MDWQNALSQLSNWAAVGFSALLVWVAKRHLDEDDRKHGKSDGRLTVLEISYVTKTDLKEVQEEVAAVRAELAHNHQEILRLLIRRP